MVMRDLTDTIGPTLTHYQTLGIDFESVYSGFLGSVDQIDLCLDFFRAYPKALSVVDPVMGDHGKPYRTVTAAMRSRMGELVSVADMITPNLTEACILLGKEHPAGPITAGECKSLLARLSEKGPGVVVITGAHLAGGTLSNLGYDRERNAYWRVDCDYVPVSYPGTGDIFASVLTGGLLTGDSLPIAMSRSTAFLELAIKTTYSFGADPRFGVMLEKCLRWLTEGVLTDHYELL